MLLRNLLNPQPVDQHVIIRLTTNESLVKHLSSRCWFLTTRTRLRSTTQPWGLSLHFNFEVKEHDEWDFLTAYAKKKEEESLSCYLTSLPCFVIPLFFSFTLSPSSSNPSLSPLLPPLPLSSLVHLWPWHPPQETNQLCLGLQRSSSTSVYSMLRVSSMDCI